MLCVGLKSCACTVLVRAQDVHVHAIVHVHVIVHAHVILHGHGIVLVHVRVNHTFVGGHWKNDEA